MRKLLSAVSAIALCWGLTAPVQAQGVSVNSNILTNPWMEIDQVNEGTSTTLTASAAATFTYRSQGDGWGGTAATSASVLSTAFKNAAVAPNGSINDVLVTVGTGSATHAAGTLLDIEQRIEPRRMAALQYGTANAQGSYLSFCAKASSAGIYSYAITRGRVQDLATVHNSYFDQFTLPAAGWACFQRYIPGNTGGTWLNTTNITDSTHGGTLLFVLGVGTTAGSTTNCPATAVGTWTNATNTCFGNQNQVAMDTVSASTFEVTGVKWSLEPTPLAHDPGLELAQANRYLAKTFAQGVTPAQAVGYANSACGIMPATTARTGGVTWTFPVTMRAAPTVTLYSPISASTAFSNFTNADAPLTSSGDPAGSASVNRYFIQEITDAANAAGNVICIHALADARL